MLAPGERSLSGATMAATLLWVWVDTGAKARVRSERGRKRPFDPALRSAFRGRFEAEAARNMQSELLDVDNMHLTNASRSSPWPAATAVGSEFAGEKVIVSADLDRSCGPKGAMHADSPWYVKR